MQNQIIIIMKFKLFFCPLKNSGSSYLCSVFEIIINEESKKQNQRTQDFHNSFPEESSHFHSSTNDPPSPSVCGGLLEYDDICTV